MSTARFGVDLEWRSDQTAGEIRVGEARTPVSEPRLMGGTKVGMSPEDLFVAAAASSYGATLADILRTARLPQSSLGIHAEGLASDPGAMRFTTITMRTTIHGADAAQRQAYEKAAIAARNHCFIGRSIRGNIAYVVGEVALVDSGTGIQGSSGEDPPISG